MIPAWQVNLLPFEPIAHLFESGSVFAVGRRIRVHGEGEFMEDIWKRYFLSKNGEAPDLRLSRVVADQFIQTVLVNLVGLSREARILDLGCGSGLVMEAARKAGYTNIEGTDISEDQTRYAREVLKIPNVHTGDASDYLKNNYASFDCITLVDVLEHLEVSYSVILLDQIRKSLRPGGVLVLRVPNGISLLSPNFYGDITHVRAYSPESLSQSFRLGGFSDYSVYAPPFPIRGVKSVIRYLLWHAFLNPLVKSFCYVAYGSPVGGIYTSDLLAIARV